LNGDDVMGNKSIKPKLIKAQLEIPRIYTCEKPNENKEKN
jgi:hypothetical protein